MKNGPRQYLSHYYRDSEDNQVVCDHITEAFDAVGKHVAQLEKRIKELEKAQMAGTGRGGR